MDTQPIVSMSYPSGIMKWLLKSPILFYRMGLGFIVGRIFMVMTTVGRKSGQPRHTAIEFHEFKARRYVFSNWGTHADWYRNIEANSHITIQTWRGAESVLARRVTSDAELRDAFDFAMSNLSMRMAMKSIGLSTDFENFLVQRERLTFVTFDPIDQPTSIPLKADLWWVWLVFISIVAIILFFVKK